MEAIQTQMDMIDKKVADFAKTQPKVEEYLKKAGVRPAYLVVGFAAFVVLFFLVTSDALCNLVGFVYPMYASMKAIKSTTKEDDTQWLTYWVIYALFNVIESITSILLCWIPFYFYVKIAFLIFLMHPTTKGAQKIFEMIGPNFKLSSVGDEALKAAKNAAKKAGVGEDVVKQVMSSASAAIGAAKIEGPGCMTVTVHSATGIPPMDSNGFADPFVQLTFRGKTFKTDKKSKSLSPVWTTKNEFKIEFKSGEDPITFDIIEHDIIGKNRPIAKKELTINDFAGGFTERSFAFENGVKDSTPTLVLSAQLD
jgi:receptor expression-enhancing protein 5/6